MNPDYIYPDSTPPSPTCYFSISLPSTHLSVETPGQTPFLACSSDTYLDPFNPLLAARRLSHIDHMSSPTEASRLQLQTATTHRPATQPLQRDSSTSSSSNSSSSSRDSSTSSRSTSMLSCCRCRRESARGLVQFGTNLYYCNHCARMTGYCAG